MKKQPLQYQIDKLMKKHPDLFPTEAKFWGYLRGALRRGLWEKSPLKFKFKANGTSPPPKSYVGRGRKGHKCALTGEWTPVGMSEVDHINGHKPLLCEADVIPYILHLLATDDQLQIVDKEAHKIKSYAERMNISFEEAKVEKDVIAYMKKSNVIIDKTLAKHGLACNNAKVRKEGVRRLMIGGDL